MPRFVLIGQRATASPDFLLDDLAGTSGRLDVLVRAMRAALLVSHGVREDTVLYLVLLGGPDAPRAVRIEGASAKFLRPDERSLATLLKKVLAAPCEDAGFTLVRPGISLARGGLDAVLADCAGATPYVLEEGAPDIRDADIVPGDAVFLIGDHLGFDESTRERLQALRATRLGLGPMSVHAEDAVTLVTNELDRRRSTPR